MARKVIAEFDAIDGPFVQKLKRIDSGISRFERGTLSSFGRVERGMDRLVSQGARLRSTTAFLGAGFGLKVASDFVDQSKLIRNALRDVGGDSQETFEAVYLSSMKSLSGFTGFAQGVQRMQKSLEGQQALTQTIRDMETLNKLLAVGGKSAQERESTMVQFTQALQSGVLQGDELRSIRENAPISFTRAIAREAGGTLADLKDLAKEGVITTEVMIRALQSLEAEADAKFANVEVTVQAAAQVFKNGAIVAAEGFDKGLGLSRATAESLQGLGEILGSDAEAAELFGKSVKVAGFALAAAFGGRKMTGFVSGVKDLTAARYAAATAADRELRTANELVAKRQLGVAATQASVDKLALQGAATQRMTSANKQAIKARTQLTAATARQAIATAGVDAAQKRLLLSTRLLTGAGSALRGAFAFLGGWPGLLLIAGTAFLTMGESAESATERLERLNQMSGQLEGSSDNLRAVLEKLNAAIETRGDKSLEASSKIIAATRQEFEAKKVLLRQEKIGEQRLQAERLKELNRLIKERADIKSIEDRVIEAMNEGAAYSGELPASYRQNITKGAAKAYNADLLALDRTIDGLQATVDLTAQSIQSANEIIGTSFDVEPAKEWGTQVDAARKMAEKFIAQNMSAAERQAAVTAEVAAAREKLVAQYGAESDIVSTLDRAMSSFQNELRKTKGDTDSLTSAATQLNQALSAVSSVHLNLGDRLSVARAQLNAAQAGANQDKVSAVGDAQQQSITLVKAGATPDQIAAAYTKTLELNLELSETQGLISAIFTPKKEGGGGATSPLKTLEKEAITAIQSMMTAEERRAQTIAKTVEIRRQLVATYGAEHISVAALTDALDRMKNELEDGKSKTDELFDTLSDRIANSINEWKGFGSLVKAILADIVRQEGVSFILKSVGSAIGGSFGESLSAEVHHAGGIAGSGTTKRQVSPRMFVGAPRYHNGGIAGLKPNEVPAILEAGERVLRKGETMGGGGMTVSIAMANDFRGVDNGMKEFLAKQMSKMEASFKPKVLQVISNLPRTREGR
ncbi:tape measure protein [Falsihalocynthiibacter sp. BN13B15]|uniref:tape measure protein n=1 Tax=Falsihalocynthiibacter sp. BN13B15 TaxID=3240871 RepID=UPI0035102D20